MRHLIFTAITVFCLFISSCSESKKETLPPPHEQSAYRVLLFNNTNTDTTISSTMWARVETVGLLLVEDDKLKAELMSYQPAPNGQGIYTVRLTNKQNCQVINRWDWEGLTLDNIQPSDSTANTPQSDVMTAYQVKTYILTGDAKAGKIKVKAYGDCGNSSQLIINITNAILPVKIIENIGRYDEKTGKTIITFTIDDPLLFDWILVQRLNGVKVWVQAMLIASDHITKTYSIKL